MLHLSLQAPIKSPDNNMRSRLPRTELSAEQLSKLGEAGVAIDENQFLTLNAIHNSAHFVDDLVVGIFPNHLHNFSNTDWICEQATWLQKVLL